MGVSYSRNDHVLSHFLLVCMHAMSEGRRNFSRGGGGGGRGGGGAV